MRPIHVAQLDKARPVLVLTRELIRGQLNTVTIAPITSTIRDISTEVRLDASNGLENECVVLCDKVQTIPAASLGRRIGFLHPGQERELYKAIVLAFDLEDMP